MASQPQTESQVIELATESFNAFCDDIAGMFGVGMQCEQQEVRAETVAGLKKCFKKLVAVNVVDATGALEGTFQLIFDQEGLFTLGGVIVMLPEQRILANRRDSSPQLAASMVDAVGEAGNLLVGCWDRVFREGIRKHGHFLQRLPAFVGKPWDEPQEKIGLAGDAELVYIPYQMTIGSYLPFSCGVIFPKSLFAGHSDVSNESVLSDKPDTPQDSNSGESKQQLPAAAQEGAKKNSKSRRRAAKKTPAEETQVQENTPETPAEEAAEVRADSQRADEAQADAGPAAGPQLAGAAADQEPAAVVAGAPPAGTPCGASGETQVVVPPIGQDAAPSQEHQEPAAGKVSQAIQKMTQSYAVLPGESDPSGHSLPVGNCRTDRPTISESAAPTPACLAVTDKSGIRQTTGRRRRTPGLSRCLSICAKDMMQGRIAWASPEETVQQALAKMQQYDTGYILVGVDGALEGIVSRSDVTGALSPYLRSIFAKWRRPLDDATLKIKIKWIMSRPVRTIRPQTPLVTIMENVCRFGGGGLPVVDEQGKVQGMVTVFNVFQMMLNTCADVPTVGKAPQTPPLA